MSEWKLKYVEGDLVKTASDYDVIVHGCNCFCTMGAGIAKTIKDKWPKVYDTDCKTSKGDANKLGRYTMSDVGDVIVDNAYTQHHYAGYKPVDYDAIQIVMSRIKIDFAGKKIGMPMIGAGLAGGSWSKIEGIIEKELEGEDVTIVKFKK